MFHPVSLLLNENSVVLVANLAQPARFPDFFAGPSLSGFAVAIQSEIVTGKALTESLPRPGRSGKTNGHKERPPFAGFPFAPQA
jgi:hypothetical protein